MVSVLSSSAMFVQLEVGEALEIIGSSKKLGLFVSFLNYFCLLGSEIYFQFVVAFSPIDSEFSVSGQAALGPREQVFQVHVL